MSRSESLLVGNERRTRERDRMLLLHQLSVSHKWEKIVEVVEPNYRLDGESPSNSEVSRNGS